MDERRKIVSEPVKRTDEAFEKDEKLTIIGPKLEVGERAPALRLEILDDPFEKPRSVWLSEEFSNKLVVLCFVNALSTPVCRNQLEHLDGLVSALIEQDSEIVSVTVTLEPTAYLAGYRAGAQIEGSYLCSDQGHPQDLEGWGVRIKEWPNMPQRAMFVILEDGTIGWCYYVKDQGSGPEARKTSVDATEFVKSLS